MTDTADTDTDNDDLDGPPEFKFPVTVTSIEFEGTKEDYSPLRTKSWRREKCGMFVAIRPCDKKFGDKTYLGIFLGEMALSVSCSFKSGVLKVGRSFYNPAILIPDLGEVVYGCESWWGAIKKPEDLHQITDADIDNVWYVKAMAMLNKEADDEQDVTGDG